MEASPQRVFDAWTDAQALSIWLAPLAESDPRPGGRYRLEVTTPQGSHVVSGEYREFVPGRRLVMSWNYAGSMAPDGIMNALLTVEFRPDGNGTAIDLLHQQLSAPAYLAAMRGGAWTEALGKLEKLLAGPDSP